MSGIDIVLFAFIALLCWLGWSQRLIRQLSLSLGMLIGLLLGVLSYSRLAFMADRSLARTILLGLLVLLIGFVSYDGLLAIGHRAEKRWPGIPLLVQRWASALLAGITGLVVIWLICHLTVAALQPAVQLRLQSSVLLRKSMQVQPPAFLTHAARALDPFGQPRTFTGAEPLFSDVAAGRYVNMDKAIAIASTSTFKITAQGCGTTSFGTGFSVDKRAIVTSAHVIAGAKRIVVQAKTSAASTVAEVIWFDPKLDVAVLLPAASLPQPPLVLQTATAKAGTPGAALGYPGGDTFASTNATVLRAIPAKGYDIYAKHTVVRNIYALRSDITAGSSGSPLVNAKGEVLGMVFGHSTAQAHTAFAITAGSMTEDIKTAVSRKTVVKNGSCVQ